MQRWLWIVGAIVLVLAAIVLTDSSLDSLAQPDAVVNGEPLAVVERGPADAEWAFVLLHGYGAAGDDLVALADWLLEQGVRVRFVMPAAPIALHSQGRAWFRQGARSLSAARSSVEDLVERIGASGVPRNRIIVGGFSQGAMLSLDIALRGHAPIGAAVLLSGRIPDGEADDYSRVAGVPIFVSHGRSDSIIAFAQHETMVDALRRAGARLEVVEFAGEHTIPSEVVDRLVPWLIGVARRPANLSSIPRPQPIPSAPVDPAEAAPSTPSDAISSAPDDRLDTTSPEDSPSAH